SLGEQAGPTRVVWRVPGRAPVVQCAGVRREGNPLAGVTVTLLTLSAPIGGETGCP
ncbi:MAG: hypothetical protein H0U79_04900, partial [Solirubrobacterales bacterium]|nr:hypothetical protein [Solirubrobacterales bacterium]